MNFKDYFSGSAQNYAAVRPVYPEELFIFLVSLTGFKRKAWDCATGSGQAAISVAKYFEVVEATDASREQIKNAIPGSRVHYSVQPAEKTSFPADTFDLVTVAQALHWFELKKFYREVKRVLKPNGIFAAWGYSFFKINPELDALFKNLVFEPLEPYWARENRLLWDGYRNIPFPFTEIPAPEFGIELNYSLQELLGFIETWSGVRTYLQQRDNNFMQTVKESILPAWCRASEKRKISMQLFLKVGANTAIDRGETSFD
ncbi:class I SAM-dependent methyltransferase [Candidatus Riflebacteria bacterium]